MTNSAPAGWYDDPAESGQLRYWTGDKWTEDYAPPRPTSRAAKDAVKTARMQRADEVSSARKDRKAATVAEKLAKQERARATKLAEKLSKRDAASAAKTQSREASHRIAEGKQQRKIEEAAAAEAAYQAVFGNTIIHGAKLRRAAMRSIMDHCLPGEQPWFVQISSGAGLLVAFDDRAMIIKTGAMTGMMAGTLGGGRITTFPFEQITGIEYNGQMINGVLEILTPSYQGTKNQDFWKGTQSSRNADASDPYTLSNALPLMKAEYRESLPQFNELRKRIIDSKKSVTQVVAAPAVASLADELQKLADLKTAGALSDQEFAVLKANLIEGIH